MRASPGLFCFPPGDSWQAHVKAAGMKPSAPLRLRVDKLGSPIGDIAIVCTDRALCAVEFGDFDDRLQALLWRRNPSYELVRSRDPLGVTARLERYFDGDLAALEDLAVDGGGSAYRERVWAALRAIPAGQTRTYAQVAAQVGATHARAVGQANSLNPIAIVVPCHRVIGANAALTGYAGGLARKRWLLDHEARHAGGAPPFWLS